MHSPQRKKDLTTEDMPPCGCGNDKGGLMEKMPDAKTVQRHAFCLRAESGDWEIFRLVQGGEASINRTNHFPPGFSGRISFSSSSRASGSASGENSGI